MASQFSVLMSVYAAEKPEYLQACLLSLASQTLLADELVLVEDGPLTQALLDVVEAHRATLNITSVHIPQNVGLAKALNIGLARCSYALVARMDSDDLCLPNRFEIQIPYLDDHPEVSVLGALVEEYDATFSVSYGQRRVPLDFQSISKFAKQRSPVSHPSVVYRKHDILSVGGYPEFRKAQDYALWSLLLSRGMQIQNLDCVVVKMRAGTELLTRRGKEYLSHEIEILKFQRRIGFINTFEYIYNYWMRSLVRRSPPSVKKLFYKLAR